MQWLVAVLDPGQSDVSFLLDTLSSVMARYAAVYADAVALQETAAEDYKCAQAKAYGDIRATQPLQAASRLTDDGVRAKALLSPNVRDAHKRLVEANREVNRLKITLEALKTQGFMVRERAQDLRSQAKNIM